jgi:hypothetical protein
VSTCLPGTTTRRKLRTNGKKSVDSRWLIDYLSMHRTEPETSAQAPL